MVSWLFIKPGIQEWGTECGECGERGECFFAKNLLKYLTNVWLSSDTTGHDSVPKISKRIIR